MLHLQAGVHLEEEEVSLFVGEEFDGACALVADGLGCQCGCLEQLLAHAVDAFDERRRSFLDDLLVPALDRAFTLAHRPHRAESIGHDLNFDVPPGFDVPLDEHRSIAEGRQGFSSGCLELRLQCIETADDAHPPTAAARGGLDQYR
ncbi:unannotated protein [freshwater metagenome]|uniref:Unannotated protein n=1 Tax=freshwater metagenome TaxID=449393 RepID=A0A6J7H046_9ZZZZ